MTSARTIAAPCPFCGCTDWLYSHYTDHAARPTPVIVYVGVCGACGEEFEIDWHEEKVTL